MRLRTLGFLVIAISVWSMTLPAVESTEATGRNGPAAPCSLGVPPLRPGDTIEGTRSDWILRLLNHDLNNFSVGLRADSDSIHGRGVLGLATSTNPSADATGVWGESRSPAGRGVLGIATALTGFNFGVWGQTSSPQGRSVFGWALASSGNPTGVWGEALSPDGRGVLGLATATSGINFGVWGQSASPDGRGVYGTTTDTNGNTTGVWGETRSPNGVGVVAQSADAIPENLGLMIYGRLEATGTKSAAVPLPDGQHALLYAEESTEVWFSDYGSVPLNNGLAVVTMDPEFLHTVDTHKEYHVFLTPRGNPTGALYIDNQTPASFEIRESTGTADIKVSYRIVAKRKNFADERLKKVALLKIQRLELKPEEINRQ